MKITPGSHNIENLAETTQLLTAMIQDTMSNTCSSTTGGLSTFLCADSTLDKVTIRTRRVGRYNCELYFTKRR